MAQTSSFSSNQAGKHVATLALQHGDGTEQQYTPFGEDTHVQLDGDAVVFELSDNPTYLEISEVVGDHKPCYIHVAGTGVDYMVPYVGQESEDGFRFAIPDTQNRALRWWLCRNGAPWDSGITYPLTDTIKMVTPKYADAKAAFDAGQTQCIKHGGLVYMLANVTNSEATYTSRDNITLKTLTVDTNNSITIYSYKVARDLGWLGIHGPSYYAGEKYVKVCELEAYPFRTVYNTRFQINISPSQSGGTNGESAIFNLSIQCTYDEDGPSFDEGIKASWECLEKQSLASSKIAQCVVVFNSNSKIEVWLEFVNASGLEAYITVLANDGNAAGAHADSTFAGPKFVYPCDYVISSSTGWDAGATAVYNYPAYEMTTAMIVSIADLDSTAAESMIAAKAAGKPIIVVKNDPGASKYLVTSAISNANKYVFRGIGRTNKDTGTGIVILEYTRATQTWTTVYTATSLTIDGSAIGSIPSSSRSGFFDDILQVIHNGGIVTILNRGCIGYFSNATTSAGTTYLTFVALLMINGTQMGTHISVLSYDTSLNILALNTTSRNWSMSP